MRATEELRLGILDSRECVVAHAKEISEVERTPQWGTQTLWEHEYSYTGWDLHEDNGNKAIDNDWTEVGASAQALAIGARVSASPIEIVDFVAGTITFGLVDIRNDDTRSKLEHRLREEKGLGQ